VIDITSIPRDQIPAAIAALAARLLIEPVPAVETCETDETWISVEVASKQIGRSPRWFYRNAKKLPFVKRLSRKVLLVGEKGMGRWIALQKA
jgi:hypothetical protein